MQNFFKTEHRLDPAPSGFFKSRPIK